MKSNGAVKMCEPCAPYYWLAKPTQLCLSSFFLLLLVTKLLFLIAVRVAAQPWRASEIFRWIYGCSSVHLRSAARARPSSLQVPHKLSWNASFDSFNQRELDEYFKVRARETDFCFTICTSKTRNTIQQHETIAQSALLFDVAANLRLEKSDTNTVKAQTFSFREKGTTKIRAAETNKNKRKNNTAQDGKYNTHFKVFHLPFSPLYLTGL